jgi:hypothetical protein
MTSIEWLIEEMLSKGFFKESVTLTNIDHLQYKAEELHKQEIIDACGMALSKLLYQQAIEKQSSDELHKQQIINAYEQGQKNTANGFYIKSGEKYYNNLKK